MGGPLEFFPTHVCDSTHPLAYITGLKIMKIEAILVFHEDVLIADLQCAMTRPGMLQYTINASIHVYVHEDLHEIYLYNVKLRFQ
jgi:hypothetical protein